MGCVAVILFMNMRYCTHCGKEVADEAVICLNCGCRIGGVYATDTQRPQPILIEDTEEDSGTATVAMICGIASFFIGWLVLGIVAIVLACLSKNDTGGKMNTAAKAGYICGWISTILSIVVIVAITAIITAVV